jgi:DNA polymerase III alpha subunit
MEEALKLEQEVVTTTDYSIIEKCLIEYETFDYMVTRHPLDFFAEWTGAPSVVRASEMYRHNGKTITMIGWYMTSKRIRTKKGDIMKFLSLEDLSGTFEAVLFPKAYAKYASSTLSMGPFRVTGIADMENGNNIVVEEITVLSMSELKSSLLKDSVDHNYYGDEEKVTDEDFRLAAKLETQKLVAAYLEG